MARIIFNTFAESHLVHHFEIKARALFNALALHQAVLLLVELNAFAQLFLDRFDGTQCGRTRCHIVARRIYGKARHTLQNLAGQRIKHRQCFDLIVKQGDAQRSFRALGRKNIDDVTAHTKHATFELDVVALVLHVDESGDGIALGDFFFLGQMQNHLMIIGGVADTVNRRHRRHDNGVATLE